MAAPVHVRSPALTLDDKTTARLRAAAMVENFRIRMSPGKSDGESMRITFASVNVKKWTVRPESCDSAAAQVNSTPMRFSSRQMT
jgi:hypothetical protein